MMIKYLLVIPLMVCCSIGYGQVTTHIQWHDGNRGHAGDTIYYDPYIKLTWNDFKGVPNTDSIATAVTESGFGYKLSMQSSGKKTDIDITVLCYFSKQKSWVRPHLKSDYALLHEQHHFDITYINACLFIQKLKAAHFTRDNFITLTEKINDECFTALENMQNDYDGQTKNGRVKQKQFEWNKIIDDRLRSLATD